MRNGYADGAEASSIFCSMVGSLDQTRLGGLVRIDGVADQWSRVVRRRHSSGYKLYSRKTKLGS